MESMVKVKAHQQAPKHEQPAERLRRLANDWADQYAKQGAELHPRPVPAVRAFQDAVWLDAVVACRTLGASTQLWLEVSGLRGIPRRLRGIPRRPRTRALRYEKAHPRKQRARARRQNARDGDRAQSATHQLVLGGAQFANVGMEQGLDHVAPTGVHGCSFRVGHERRDTTYAKVSCMTFR